MISNLNNNDEIKMKLFGKEKILKVFSTGDNKFDEKGQYKEDNFELNNEEIELLNWFINNIKIEDYKNEILNYCNKKYINNSNKKIKIDDIEDEINIYKIAINIKKKEELNKEKIYPEISFIGDCKCDEEHGICIGFKDKEFLGIDTQDWIF